MSAVSHGTRHLRQGISGTKHHAPVTGSARSLHSSAFIPPLRTPHPSTAQRIFTNSRNLVSRFFAHLTTPGLAHSVAVAPSHSLVRPAHFHSSAQSVKASYSLPVRNALYRPLSLPRLPRPTPIPGNVANVGLGTARSFHSARPIFQNLVDNVPITTRALWEAEWELKAKKKEERKFRKAKENVVPSKTKEMLKPKQKLVVAEVPAEIDISELDHYMPQPALPEVTTYLLVPIAPTPTSRLPLSALSTVGTSSFHPLLPVPEIAAAHKTHRNHSLRVSTLFSRLDAASVWDDPGVGVDAYAFGSNLGDNPSDKQCTILRVTFAGWTAAQVRSVTGDSGQGWCAFEEVYSDAMSASSQTSSIDEEEVLSNIELDSDDWDYGLGLSPSPDIHENFVLPTLDFSSSFAQVASPTQSWTPPPNIILRTASELAEEFGNVWSPTSSSSLS
ncbi:hypothetical protein C8R48DRAFT_539291, partial [Suillus tomentosus]